MLHVRVQSRDANADLRTRDEREVRIERYSAVRVDFRLEALDRLKILSRVVTAILVGKAP